MKSLLANLLDQTKKNVKHLTKQIWIERKLDRNELAADCMEGWLKAEELCATCVSVSPFRWLDCRLFVRTACDSIHREPVKPNTLSGKKKAFPKTAAWFLYEVQRHPRWAWTRGSLLNLTLNTPNKPTPLEISFEKLSRLVFFGFFLVSFSGGCPRCNIADVNQCEKRRSEKVERIRRSWPLFTREGYLCERGEGSSLGYETSDFWCWQELLTFAIKLEFVDD